MQSDPPFVVVADDDLRALSTLRDALRVAGAQVAACRQVSVALDAITFHVPTVVVTDVAMENGKGWDVVHAARAAGRLSTLVLDRIDDAGTRRAAFAAGADEVIRVPYVLDELTTRVIALAGRAGRGVPGTVYRLHGLSIDVSAHAVRLDGRPVVLTAQQFAILAALFEANGVALPRARLLARIEALDDEPPSERAIDLHVARLRRRLGDDAREPRYIESVYGLGYRLATDAPGPARLGDRAESLLAALPDALLVIDAHRAVRFANDAATRLLARPQSELVGRTCGELLECTDCMDISLEGPRCFARALLPGTAALRDMPARIRAGDERVSVLLTYGQVQADGLVTLQIRPRTADDPKGTASPA
ncbi:MAG TPA: winged helix-turn-helix domain-containing protein [Coriobacteriia bacterium]